MTNTDIITPTIAMIIAMINEYAAAIANDTASDSTLDAMQYDIDCILFRDDIPADMLEYADFAAIDESLFADSHISDIESLRAYANAAFMLRP